MGAVRGRRLPSDRRRKVSIGAAVFFGLWRRVVKNAGGASAIPGVWRLVPKRWRKDAQEQVDKKIAKVGK
jgi:hypothetical protein